MQIYGLTGGIASGKSAVAETLASLGAAIVDADQLARQIVAPGQPALQEIRTEFGPAIFTENGTLDRKALGSIVFSNPSARKKLNAITHPKIAQAGQRAMAQLRQDGHALAFYEAPLIVENNLHLGMDGLIVVSIPRDLQIERLMLRDSISKEDAEARINSQLPLSDKVAVANYVVDNSGSKENTNKQIEQLWKKLSSDADSREDAGD